MVVKNGKVWGETQPILVNPILELHKIKFKNNTQCSKHKHKTKFNAFIVTKGLLRIDVWKNDYDLIDSTVLSDGDMMIVPPGEFHRFVALSDGEAFELYWTELDHNDIEREDVGGVSKVHS